MTFINLSCYLSWVVPQPQDGHTAPHWMEALLDGQTGLAREGQKHGDFRRLFMAPPQGCFLYLRQG